MVQFEKTLRTAVRMNNANDTLRSYDISAEVQTNEVKNITGISSGAVLRDVSAVATFAMYGNELSVQYIGLEAEEQNVVNNAINNFISEVRDAILSATSISL